jgi:hypothetical protein
MLVQLLKTLLHHLEVTQRGKRVKTYVTQLADLDQAFSKKWEEVDKATLLTEGILQGKETMDFAALSKQRLAERTAMLTEIRSEVDVEAPPTRKRKPRKERLPGEKKTKSKKTDGRNTFEQTLDLINSGMTVDQIATERGLVVGTIESHLAKAVADGTLSIFKFMTEETVIEIIDAFRQLPEGSSSKDLYNKLKGKYGYGPLHAVIAYSKTSG